MTVSTTASTVAKVWGFTLTTPPDRVGLLSQGGRELARQVLKESGLPLEPSVDGPDDAEGEAHEADST